MAYNIFDFSHFWSNLKTLLSNKVDKVSGMGLSQNSFTNAEKTKLADTYIKSEVDTALAEKLNTSDVDEALSSTSTNPVQNKVVKSALDSKADATDIPTVPITTVQKNGTDITPVSGTVNITVPTAAADISALSDTTKYAAALSLTINSSTFVVTCQLKDQNGDNLGTAQTIDLPLESVVVGGSYNSQTKKVVLTLQNGDTIEFSVADLVSGLQTELSESNKLNPAYINYDSTHRAVSDTEKSTWNNKQDSLTTAQLAAVNSGITTERLETIDAALSDKVDKETGKGLSTNDFTNADKENLETALTKANAAAPQSTTYTKSEVDAAIDEAIEHGGGGTTDYNQLTNKPSVNGVVLTGNKTTSDLGIEENVQADWDEKDSTAPSYIKNKPNIPAGVVVDITYDGTSENAQAGTAVAQAISTKVDKVTGKGLSTNDFTNTDMENLATALTKANAAAPQDNTYTKQQVDDAINSKSVSINAVGDSLIIITN